MEGVPVHKRVSILLSSYSPTAPKAVFQIEQACTRIGVTVKERKQDSSDCCLSGKWLL